MTYLRRHAPRVERVVAKLPWWRARTLAAAFRGLRTGDADVDRLLTAMASDLAAQADRTTDR